MVSFCCNRFKSEWDFVNELLISFKVDVGINEFICYDIQIPDAFKHGSEELFLYVTIIFLIRQYQNLFES
jgi:hypothetical protein